MTTSTRDLLNYANKLDIPLMVVSVLDLKRSNYQSKQDNLIINSDTKNLGGTHWTCLHFNKRMVILFDPFGAQPSPEILAYAKKHWPKKPVVAVNTQSQDPEYSTCGPWCIFFLYSMNNGVKLSQFMSSLTDNTLANEKLLKDFLEMIH